MKTLSVILQPARIEDKAASHRDVVTDFVNRFHSDYCVALVKNGLRQPVSLRTQQIDAPSKMVEFTQWIPGEFYPNQLATIRKTGFELVKIYVTAVGDMPPDRFGGAVLPGMGFADGEDTGSLSW